MVHGTLDHIDVVCVCEREKDFTHILHVFFLLCPPPLAYFHGWDIHTYIKYNYTYEIHVYEFIIYTYITFLNKLCRLCRMSRRLGVSKFRNKICETRFKISSLYPIFVVVCISITFSTYFVHPAVLSLFVLPITLDVATYLINP